MFDRKHASDILYSSGFSRQMISALLGAASNQRAEIASRLLSGFYANRMTGGATMETLVSDAVRVADALIAELNKKP